MTGREPRSSPLLAGVVLAIPIYLIALELFGSSTAWLACLLIYLIPFNGHLLADALREHATPVLEFWRLVELEVASNRQTGLASPGCIIQRAGLP